MLIKKCLGLAAGLLGTALTLSAHADGLGYTYLDVDYFHVSPDNQSITTGYHSYGLVGSYALPANFVLTGSYIRSHYVADKFNPQFGDYTENDRHLGLGYRISLSERFDLVPGVTYRSDQIKGPSSAGRFPFFFPSLTAKGYDLSLTPRLRATDSLELNAEVDHFYTRYETTNTGPFVLVDHSNGNDISVGLVYSFTPHFAVGTDYGRSTSSHLTSKTYDVFGRFYF